MVVVGSYLFSYEQANKQAGIESIIVYFHIYFYQFLSDQRLHGACNRSHEKFFVEQSLFQSTNSIYFAFSDKKMFDKRYVETALKPDFSML